MLGSFGDHLISVLGQIEADGLYKRERQIAGPQGGRIRVRADGKEREMLNLCANNYLGLADHPEVIAAARAALDSHGFGMASVRFICGTQDLHRELEQGSPATWARTTRSCSRPASMPMAGCSRRC
jgi:glycine C-acetyltransferase